MQNIEYSFITLIQGSCNNFSTIGLWGGCMAIKKDAFFKVGMLTKNAIIEDSDLALKLSNYNYKVEQSFYSVYTNAPNKFKKWYKQKLRWGSGFIQCFFRYFKTYLTHPVTLMLGFFSTLTMILSIILFLNNLNSIKEILIDLVLTFKTSTSLKYFFKSLEAFLPFILNILIATVLFPLRQVQYVIFNVMNNSKNYKEILLIYPYTIIYLPVLSIIYFLSFFLAIYKMIKLRKEDVGWKG
jgi:biofilm PGA synthesis N-glycosyltransferase PgaC